MSRRNKFNYDSDKFYEDISSLAMQGFTDAEISHALRDFEGLPLSPETFCRMKNGNYIGWTEKENKERSEHILQVLARARRKITVLVRGAFLKCALGGKKIKSNSTLYHSLSSGGVCSEPEEMRRTDFIREEAPNIHALETWMYHNDEEWRNTEENRQEEQDSGVDVIKVLLSKH